MIKHYRLKHRKPVTCDISTWRRDLLDMTRRRIRAHNVGGVFISTVFLGIPHAGGLFETAVRYGGGYEVVGRANTHREALKLHRSTKQRIKNR